MMRLPATYARAWFCAAAMVGLVGAAPAAHAALIGYDIIFECDAGCVTGVDAPSGMLWIDELALTDGSGISLVLDGNGSMMIDALGAQFTEADDTSEPVFPTVTVVNDEVVGIIFVHFGDPELMLSTSGAWSYFETTTGAPVEASGSYALTRKDTAPIPEPGAAMLFGVGTLVVGTRLRRRPGS